jgi:hypothetical protein
MGAGAFWLPGPAKPTVDKDVEPLEVVKSGNNPGDESARSKNN